MLYWAFYKSTLTLNIVVSFAIALVAMMVSGGNFFAAFAVSYMSVGLLVALLFKEINCPMEYYFYYNQSLSKIKLIVFCLLVNTLPSMLILTIVYYVTSS